MDSHADDGHRHDPLDDLADPGATPEQIAQQRDLHRVIAALEPLNRAQRACAPNWSPEMKTTMELDTLKTTWKSLDERLARIEALQTEANAIERARDAEARANAGQLAWRAA